MAAAEEDLWLLPKVFTANGTRLVISPPTTRHLLYLKTGHAEVNAHPPTLTWRYGLAYSRVVCDRHLLPLLLCESGRGTFDESHALREAQLQPNETNTHAHRQEKKE